MVQLALTAPQIDQVNLLTNFGASDFWRGYEYISSLIENDSNVDDLTKFWFQEAANINKGVTPSGSNLFIRSDLRP